MRSSDNPPLLATVVYPRRQSQVMLATKMTGIGVGYLNGWGGGVEEGESIEESAVREFKEETGGAEISVRALHFAGVINVKNRKLDGRVVECEVHIYTVSAWFGKINSTFEMRNPGWHNIHNLTRLNLVSGDKYWLPHFLQVRTVPLKAWLEYGPGQKELLSVPRIERYNPR